MPAKSRRKRGKYSSQGRKTGGLSRPRAKPSAEAQASQPARQVLQGERSRPVVSSPSNKTAPLAKPAAVQYPYIATELRTIAILTGIMLAILVVLVLVLS